MAASEEVKQEENGNGEASGVVVPVGASSSGKNTATAAAASTSTSKSTSDPERAAAIENSSITNSEDPKLIRARIFVGNLPGDLRTEKGDMYDKFRKHGRIMGVSIHSRFAFVQFENENDAKTAVKEENRSEFRSFKLEIKMAIEGRVTNRIREERERRRSRSPLDRDRDRRRPRTRSPVDRRRESRDQRDRSRDNYRGRGGGRSRSPSPPPYVPTPIEDRFCHPRTFGANDVELVVIRKQQGQYAEQILNRLYECRITANVLFLAEHAALDGAINEFGRCGTHYVIIIMPKHEETRAMTINMFEGDAKPHEYRNLGIEEGVALINRHFNEHYPALARLRTAEIQGPHFYPPAPAEVTRTLTRVAEMSAVPTSSLDSTIRYLQEMRERTAAFEGLAALPPVVPVVPVVAGPYVAAPVRPMDVDTGIGKGYAMDDRSRLMAAAASEQDTIRDSLLGLLKATGLTGIPSVGAQGVGGSGIAPSSAYSGAAASGGGGGDYRYAAAGGGAYGQSAGTAYSQAAALNAASMAGLAADPIALQKALASLGVLGNSVVGGGAGGSAQSQGLGGGPTTASPAQQQHSQREPQQQSGLASYRTGGGGGGGSGQQSQQRQDQNQSDDNNGSAIGYGSHSSHHQQQAQSHQQSVIDRSGPNQYGPSSQSYSNGSHAQQQLTAAQLASLSRSVGGGSVGQASQVGGSGGPLYVTTGAGGGAYMMQAGQQQIQRTIPQQQTQQSGGYSSVSRR